MKNKITRAHNPFWLVALALFSLLFIASTNQAEAQSTSTPTSTPSVFFQISKIISPAHFPGVLDAEDFSFHISGPGGTWDVAHGGVIEIDEAGQYELTESYTGNDPVGFDPEDWTVYWVGDFCFGPTDVPATDPGLMLIEESDFGFYNSNNPARCNAENQYYPVDDNGGGNGNGATSTLRVVKVVVGTSTAPSDFSFSVNGGASVQFDADGTNELVVATGTYSIAEVGTTTNYSISYSSDCVNVVLDAGGTGICTITNTWNNSSGGGNGGDKEYRIEGYVWHDQNESDVKDEGESFLEGWVVSITNGTETATTSTNSAGYYFFDVEAGTWTVSEVLQENWFQSYPATSTDTGVHVVTVPQENEEVTMLPFPLNWLFNVAEAAVVETYSGYNFGNFQGGTGGGGNGGDDDDDNGGGGGGGGSNRRGGSDNDGGTPQILGAQVSPMPMGGGQGGFGGSSSSLPPSLAFLYPVLAWMGF